MLHRQYSDGVEILSLEADKLAGLLKAIAQRIKAEHPEVREIILFGSFARGNFTPHSDVDIAIIVSNGDKNFIKRSDDFIDYFMDVPLDTNLVVYTTEEFDRMIKGGNKFALEIEKGLRL